MGNRGILFSVTLGQLPSIELVSRNFTISEISDDIASTSSG
jgi:hypothetical protein